ncbi:MAG TPA: hypothetical protein VEN78_31885 [Bradyrhizobium sp.]|jgi:uncharacterized membrane protein|nr:hypothetical protein [Bradyrhizobium sp.]
MVNHALIPRPGEGAELVANGVPSVAWNHVRTIAPMVSAILFTAALCLA